MKKAKENTAAASASTSLDQIRLAASAVVQATLAHVTPIAEFRKLDALTLAARMKTAGGITASVEMEIGKMLVVMDEQRGDKGTLQSYVRKEVGEISSTAYKVAVAWGMVGTGFGFVEENEFDQIPVRWLIVVSAILNQLGKEPAKNDETLVIGTREEVAIVLRTRPKNGYDTLRSIKKCLTPAKEESAEDGDAEGEGEENAEQKGEKFPLLSAEMLKALKNALSDCSDPALLELMKNGFSALSAIAEGQLADLTPAIAA